MSKVRVTARQPNFVAHWGESARWRPGRRLYTWHIHASGYPQLNSLVHRYQDRLKAFPFLDPTWLPRRPLRSVVSRAAKGIRADSAELPAPFAVVIAYANASGPIQEVKDALREEAGTPMSTVVKSVSLDLMNRDYREYLWTSLETATYQVAGHGE